MRHFLATLAVAPLPLGMRVATTKALLVTLARGTQRLGSGSSSAAVGAIALTTVAMAADEHRAAAAGTEITSSWSLHRQEKPMGIRQNRSKSEILSTQRRPPGHGARHRLKLPRFGAGVAPASKGSRLFSAFAATPPSPRLDDYRSPTRITSHRLAAVRARGAPVALRAPSNTPRSHLQPKPCPAATTQTKTNPDKPLAARFKRISIAVHTRFT